MFTSVRILQMVDITYLLQLHCQIRDITFVMLGSRFVNKSIGISSLIERKGIEENTYNQVSKIGREERWT